MLKDNVPQATYTSLQVELWEGGGEEGLKLTISWSVEKYNKFHKPTSAGGPSFLHGIALQPEKKGIYLPCMEKYLHAEFDILIKFGYFSKAKFYIFSNAFSFISNILRAWNAKGKYCQLKCQQNIFKLQYIILTPKRLIYNDFFFFFSKSFSFNDWLMSETLTQ